MPNKLFVAGFPYALTEQELNDAFSKAGTVVSAKIINDKDTGRSRGFGFVEMSTQEEADAAIQMWNGQDLGGRRVTVNEARPMESRRSYNDYGSRGYDKPRPRNDREREERMY